MSPRSYGSWNGTGNVAPASSISCTDTTVDGYVLSLNQALFDLPAWFSFKSGKEISKEAEATFAANQQNLIVRVVEAYLGDEMAEPA